MVTAFYVYDPISELSSKAFRTEEEAEEELHELRYGREAYVMCVDDEYDDVFEEED